MVVIVETKDGRCVRIELVPGESKAIKKVLHSKAFEEANEPWNLLYEKTGFKRVELSEEYDTRIVPVVEVCLIEDEVFIRVE